VAHNKEDRKIRYDINQSYGLNGDLRVFLTDEADAISQSIKNIVTTLFSARYKNRDFGVNYQDLLLNALTLSRGSTSLLILAAAIHSEEPRVRVLTRVSKVRIDKIAREMILLIVYERIQTAERKELAFSVPIKGEI